MVSECGRRRAGRSAPVVPISVDGPDGSRPATIRHSRGIKHGRAHRVRGLTELLDDTEKDETT